LRDENPSVFLAKKRYLYAEGVLLVS